MSLTEEQLETIGAFREYVEDHCAMDDRYGERTRLERPDWNLYVTRFAAGDNKWFAVAVRAATPEVRVGFVTNDQDVCKEVAEGVVESGESLAQLVEFGFRETDLEWGAPPVEQDCTDGEWCRFTTPLALEELSELDGDEVRNKVLKMLEGYLIAFGPLIEIPGFDEFDDEDEG